jgi:hypothetical protein
VKRHDPEGAAARYLAGTMTGRGRRRFEGHLVDCPECWEEVRMGGLGRSMAESGRELAPQSLRDRVRGAVALARPHRPWWRRQAGASAAAVLVAAVVGGIVAGRGQPRAIEALVADFRGDRVVTGPAVPELPARVGDLSLVDVDAGSVEGISLVVHRYRDPAGQLVAVYRGDRAFPTARGADPGPRPRTWHSEVDGTALFCADDPFPALVIGEDRRVVDLAAGLLGLA